MSFFHFLLILYKKLKIIDRSYLLYIRYLLYEKTFKHRFVNTNKYDMLSKSKKLCEIDTKLFIRKGKRMKKGIKGNSREVGLKIGWLFGEYFLKLEHLHYGYWTGELEEDITNLRSAQEEYVKFVFSHIPKDVKSILDVGCGSGRVTHRLLSQGYKVDCVSPNDYLAGKARELIGRQSEIFECKYEKLETQKRYDMIMFLESFQYINLEKALLNTSKLLNDNGYLFICDIFKKDIKDEHEQKGGHELKNFFEQIEKYPFTRLEDIDITERTAPNIRLLDDAMKQVAKPVIDTIGDFLAYRYPKSFKLISWKYQNELDKNYKKYFGGGRTAEDFIKFKTYRLLIYRKDASK